MDALDTRRNSGGRVARDRGPRRAQARAWWGKSRDRTRTAVNYNAIPEVGV
jgi:hypothetical protein